MKVKRTLFYRYRRVNICTWSCVEFGDALWGRKGWQSTSRGSAKRRGYRGRGRACRGGQRRPKWSHYTRIWILGVFARRDGIRRLKGSLWRVKNHFRHLQRWRLHCPARIRLQSRRDRIWGSKRGGKCWGDKFPERKRPHKIPHKTQFLEWKRIRGSQRRASAIQYVALWNPRNFGISKIKFQNCNITK